MQLFELVSPRLFRPLAGPNRAFYAELLLLLWEECRHTADYSISRAEAVWRAEDYFAALAKPLALDADGAGDEDEQPTRDPHTLAVGFLLPSLSAYTYKIQNGMNLYNMGFACGLFAMMVVPILTAFGDKPDSVLYWSTGLNFELSLACGALCVVFILIGTFGCGDPAWAVWAGYRRLLSTTGRAPNDYLRMFGAGPVMVNIGINGLIGIAYVLLVGGDLNGPTLGGIFTIMGFSAFGKHPRNIIPVMFGVWLGAYGMHYEPNYPALQLAGLFGTTLAPVAGHFGPVCGILAGFIHSALVLQTGGPVAGLNLYNNGFSGGLIAIVLYPTLTAIIRHRRPKLRDADYYDLFEADQPINMSNWHTHRPTPEEKAAEAAGRMTDDLPEREGFQRMQKNEKKENG